MIVLPKVSVDGVAKVGLMQSRELEARVVALIREHRSFPTLAENVDVAYLTRSEILSRLRYDRYISSFDIADGKFIIAHNVTGAVAAHRLHQRFHIPYSIYMHDARYSAIPGTLPRFDDAEIRQALNGARAVFTNSNKTANELDELYSVRGNPLYPGCDSSAEINAKKQNYLLYVHSIAYDARKDFDMLLKLVKQNNHVKLIIAGARRYGWQLIYLKFKMAFGNRVRFFFNPSEHDLSILYQRSKLLIHPAIENFGLSPLEAAGQGTPSIVAEGSGVLEILRDGREITSYNGTFDDLQSVFLTHTETRLRELGSSAWKRAREFDWHLHGRLLKEQIEK
jgi:glycosyltransferase involved in cell wall biosynthesis